MAAGAVSAGSAAAALKQPQTSTTTWRGDGWIALGTTTTSPESGNMWPEREKITQATWTSPITNKLFLEAAAGGSFSRYGGQEVPGNQTADIPRIVEQCTAGCANNGGIQNLTYASQNWVNNQGLQSTWRASASYVTGAHAIRATRFGALRILVLARRMERGN